MSKAIEITGRVATALNASIKVLIAMKEFGEEPEPLMWLRSINVTKKFGDFITIRSYFWINGDRLNRLELDTELVLAPCPNNSVPLKVVVWFPCSGRLERWYFDMAGKVSKTLSE